MKIFVVKYNTILLLLCLLISRGYAAEKPTGPQETCVTEECHIVYKTKSHIHAPVELDDCKSCHKPLDPNEHTYKLLREGKELCEYCHLDQTARKYDHEPLETGDCMQCHDPHSSDNEFLLLESSVAANCAKCHEDTTKDLKFLHGPTAVGQCTICHEAHSSDNENLLVSEHSALCFSCHVVTQEELTKYEFVHDPVLEDCIGCHDPHGADNSNMVKGQIPNLCYSCHEDIQKIAEDSPYKHAAATETNGCTNCHTPHASTVRYLLAKDAKDLCMTCHDKPLQKDNDETIPSFGDEIKNKKYLHGPVADNDCSGCHVAHGSQYFRLLAKNYPPFFYAPFSEENYELCFSCHSKSLAETQTTLELTDFRNGDENLHFLHVDDDTRGRTCRACHATHASDLPKHIRETVPFGMWELPIAFIKTDTGGSCSPGCHLPKAYDRKKPVDYTLPNLPSKSEMDIEG